MATFDYNRTNLGAATLSSSITAAATTATVGASDAATFPTAPFYATVMPVGETPNQLNSEIVQVTANNSGALGLVRAQRGTTAKAFDAGALVMNGVYIQDLEQAQAVGKSFFSATLTSGVYYINDSRVPTTPADGDSIRVVFGSNWTSGTPQLSLNNGTAKNIYAGNNLTSGNASTTTNAMVKSGVIYELTYYNGSWYVLNLVANNSITSDNMDWTTSIASYSNNDVNHAATVTIQSASVNVMCDPKKKIAMVWGRVQTTATASVETQVYVQTDLRPTTQLDVSPCGIVYGVNGSNQLTSNFAVNSLVLKTDGTLYMRSINWNEPSSGNRMVSIVFPTIFILG